jgi:PAS domain S-box-containing protein
MGGALQAMFQLGTAPAFFLDGTGTVVDCNARARALFCGRCREGLSCGAGGWLHALGDPPGVAEAAAASAAMEEARHVGVARLSWACRRPDGTPFDAELELVSLHPFDQDGYLCTIRDETERRRSEREARERQAELAREIAVATRDLEAVNRDLREQVAERGRAEQAARAAYRELELIFHTATGGMRVIDDDFNVLRANETLARMVGIPCQEMVNRKCWETFPGSACDTESCSLLRMRQGESHIACDVEKRAADGRTLSCALEVRKIWDEDGRLLGIVEDFRDVTETRRLQAVAEALNVSNNIGFTFSGIRHELGNPVNALKTNLTVLKLRLDSLSREELVGYVDRALSDVGRMEYLLSFLKSYSMFERLVAQAVPLGPYLESLISLLTADAHRHGVIIQSRCERPDLTAWADPRALQQVLVNLVANALDALEGRPAPRIDITVRQAGAYVHIAVRDNGIGVPLGARQAVFQPFYTTKPGGSGLGLSIVKKLLASMNGTVGISSEVGRGTRIDLSLPMEPSSGATQRPDRR